MKFPGKSIKRARTVQYGHHTAYAAAECAFVMLSLAIVDQLPESLRYRLDSFYP